MINEKHAKEYCKDYTKIKNYEEAISDKNEMWHCHHIMVEVFTSKELIRAGWYYNRRPEELIFIRESEHNGNPRIHIGLKRYNKSKIGKKPWNAGKKLSEDIKKKLSEAHKGKKQSDESKKKKSEKMKKYKWYNNGVINTRCLECPEGFVPGRIK